MWQDREKKKGEEEEVKPGSKKRFKRNEKERLSYLGQIHVNQILPSVFYYSQVKVSSSSFNAAIPLLKNIIKVI